MIAAFTSKLVENKHSNLQLIVKVSIDASYKEIVATYNYLVKLEEQINLTHLLGNMTRRSIKCKRAFCVKQIFHKKHLRFYKSFFSINFILLLYIFPNVMISTFRSCRMNYDGCVSCLERMFSLDG